MYRIGDFSVLAKTTIKTLRYYEKENLLIPCFVDKETNYRYYDTEQLVDLVKIISLRQIGLSISEIKKVQRNNCYEETLLKRKAEIEKELDLQKIQLTKINYLLEERAMDYEVIVKELPSYTVYYKEGIIKEFNDMVQFILSSADECKATNPDIKCVTPEYCYVSYLDKDFKGVNMKIRYAQAVKEAGVPNETIKFETLKPLTALCIYHKGSYQGLPKAYAYIMKYIEENNYRIIEAPRERYIDGMWNKENEAEWLTEIQVPIEKK